MLQNRQLDIFAVSGAEIYLLLCPFRDYHYFMFYWATVSAVISVWSFCYPVFLLVFYLYLSRILNKLEMHGRA